MIGAWSSTNSAAAVLRLSGTARMDVLLEVEGQPAAIEEAAAATGVPARQLHSRSSARISQRAIQQRTGTAPALNVRGDWARESPAWPDWAHRA